jgi:hypothetical protein
MRLLTLACLLGASCVFVDVAGTPSAQSEIVVQGDYRHPSGAVFPERIAGFHRGIITAYSADGSNAGVAYQVFTFAVGLPVFVTVYVYPRKGQELRDHFQNVIAEVRQYHPGAEVQNAELDRSPGRSAAAPQVGARLCYETRIGDRNEKVASYALLGGTARWWVKVRATFPVDLEERTLQPFAAFLAKLPAPEAPAPELQGSR